MKLDLPIRCQHAAGTSYQCIFMDGHKGDHMSEHDAEGARRRNANPTLEDIRKVVREEIRAALSAEGGQ